MRAAFAKIHSSARSCILLRAVVGRSTTIALIAYALILIVNALFRSLSEDA